MASTTIEPTLVPSFFACDRAMSWHRSSDSWASLPSGKSYTIAALRAGKALDLTGHVL